MGETDQTFEARVEAGVLTLGEAIWARTRGEVPGVFDATFWAGKLLNWVMENPGFKVSLFRLIDLLPTLRTAEQVRLHVQEYLLDGVELPPSVRTGLKLASGGASGRLSARAF